MFKGRRVRATECLTVRLDLGLNQAGMDGNIAYRHVALHGIRGQYSVTVLALGCFSIVMEHRKTVNIFECFVLNRHILLCYSISGLQGYDTALQRLIALEYSFSV